MRDRCPRNTDLITVEEIAAADYHLTTVGPSVRYAFNSWNVV
jgi:hypothetical protein